MKKKKRLENERLAICLVRVEIVFSILFKGKGWNRR